MDALQFSVLPSGALVALLVVGWLVFFLCRSEQRRSAVGVLLFSLIASAIVVAALHLTLRLPWIAACIDCLAGYTAYSYLLTFVQAFGWFGGLANILLRLAKGRSPRHA